MRKEYYSRTCMALVKTDSSFIIKKQYVLISLCHGTGIMFKNTIKIISLSAFFLQSLHKRLHSMPIYLLYNLRVLETKSAALILILMLMMTMYFLYAIEIFKLSFLQLMVTKLSKSSLLISYAHS